MAAPRKMSGRKVIAKDYVSIREYADIKGVAMNAIRYHIKEGRLEGCIDYTTPHRPKINVALADKALAQYINPDYQVGKNLAATEPDAVKSDEPRKSLNEIKRLTAEIIMQQKDLELRKEKGEVVDKDVVYKTLFKAGQELREAFKGIPDRVIDDVLAAPDRLTSHAILSDAITDVLERFSEIAEREITKR